MKKKFFHKCILTLGLIFIFSLLLPFVGSDISTAQATSIEATKKEEYRLNVKGITLVKGKPFPLKVYNIPEKAKISFKSDDQEIASVSDEGVITANKVGFTIITVIIKDDSTVTNLPCEVLVGPPAFSIKITKSRIIIGLDKSDFINVILKPSNTVEVARFSSKEPSIVSVSTGGRITARKLGLTYVFAEIDATDSAGVRRYDTCTVIVTNPDDAPLLETYFNDHPELDLIPRDDLTSAIDEFFNVKYQPSANASMVSSLNTYLDDKYKLADLRAAREASLTKNQNNLIGTVSNTVK